VNAVGNSLKGINDAVRFLAELAVLAAVGYGGFHDHSSSAAKLVLGVGGPVLIATAWGYLDGAVIDPTGPRRHACTTGSPDLRAGHRSTRGLDWDGARRHLRGRCHSERSAGPRSRQDVTDRSCGLSPTAAASTLSL